MPEQQTDPWMTLREAITALYGEVGTFRASVLNAVMFALEKCRLTVERRHAAELDKLREAVITRDMEIARLRGAYVK